MESIKCVAEIVTSLVFNFYFFHFQLRNITPATPTPSPPIEPTQPSAAPTGDGFPSMSLEEAKAKALGGRKKRQVKASSKDYSEKYRLFNDL